MRGIFLLISLLLKVVFSNVTERICGLGSIFKKTSVDLIGNNKLNAQTEFKKISSLNQRVLARCNVCRAKFVWGRGA